LERRKGIWIGEKEGNKEWREGRKYGLGRIYSILEGGREYELEK
jgi:hypothetical protein